jgi:branched-chain amino acid aminotransferase
MDHVCFNGKIIAGNEPVFLPSNRSYRYGDGLFETIKVLNGQMMLKEFHFERLFSGLAFLHYNMPSLFTAERIEKEILALCKKNNCEKMARVRLSVSRGNGGLYDEDRNLEYLVECWTLEDSMNQLNKNGLVIDIYPDARKSSDAFSNLKSANFLPYSLAAIYAKENKLNDCLILNTKERIADSTIANVFIVKNGMIITSPLQDGCINGVMRRHLLAILPANGYKVLEQTLSVNDLESADEVFLTNAIRGIRWVGKFRDQVYTNRVSFEIYDRFLKTIHA